MNSLILTQLTLIISSLQGIKEVLQSQPFWDSQLFGTIVGALIGLIPYIYTVYKDRPIIKVKKSHIFSPAPLGWGSQLRSGISISISNSGRRPITIQSVFLEFKNGESLIFSSQNFLNGADGLPKNLGEGNSHTVAILAGELARPFLKQQSYPIHACYADALGKIYKCDISQQFWDTMFKVDGSDKGGPTETPKSQMS